MKRKTNIVVSVILMLAMLSGCNITSQSSLPENSESDSSVSENISSTEESDTSSSQVTTTTTAAATTATTASADTTISATTAATTNKVPETAGTTASVPSTEAEKPQTTTTAAKPQTTTANAKPQTTTTTKPQTTTTTASNIPEELQPSADDSPVMAQYKEKYESFMKFMEKIEKDRTTPTINITTLDRQQILSKEFYVDSVVDVFNCDEQFRLTAEGGVKVRGNSTAEGSEKPYRIKFEKKQNMMGLHDGEKFKSWVLLKSNWNLVMDYTGFELAETIFDGKYYSSDCCFVNVYVNRAFKGIYLLCEQNQATDGRVEVYEPSEEETQADIGYFLELDNNANPEEDPCFTLDYDEQTFTDYVGKTQKFERDDYSIKSDTTSDEQRKFIEKYMNNVFTILYNGVEDVENPLMFDQNYDLVSAKGVYQNGEEAIRAVIDVDSVAYTMILQELVHNYDVGAGSFYMAIDFSADSQYKKLTFTAPWDFNWGYDTNGGTEGYFAGAFQTPVHDMWDRSNAWLTVIMKADWFRELLKEKWAELDNGKALNAPLARVLKAAKALEHDLGNDSWKIDSAKQVVQFVRDRIVWLDKQWGTT